MHVSAHSYRKSTIRNRKSKIGYRKSTIENRQSKIKNQLSKIDNQESKIENRQSRIENRKSLALHITDPCARSCTACTITQIISRTYETTASNVAALEALFGSLPSIARLASLHVINFVVQCCCCCFVFFGLGGLYAMVQECTRRRDGDSQRASKCLQAG